MYHIGLITDDGIVKSKILVSNAQEALVYFNNFKKNPKAFSEEFEFINALVLNVIENQQPFVSFTLIKFDIDLK